MILFASERFYRAFSLGEIERERNDPFYRPRLPKMSGSFPTRTSKQSAANCLRSLYRKISPPLVTRVTDEGIIFACPARSLPCDDFRIRAPDGNGVALVIKLNQRDFARANDVRPTISRWSANVGRMSITPESALNDSVETMIL